MRGFGFGHLKRHNNSAPIMSVTASHGVNRINGINGPSVRGETRGEVESGPHVREEAAPLSI
jgi:hypothetical protein